MCSLMAVVQFMRYCIVRKHKRQHSHRIHSADTGALSLSSTIFEGTNGAVRSSMLVEDDLRMFSLKSFFVYCITKKSTIWVWLWHLLAGTAMFMLSSVLFDITALSLR
jgi:hypothetical protein